MDPLLSKRIPNSKKILAQVAALTTERVREAAIPIIDEIIPFLSEVAHQGGGCVYCDYVDLDVADAIVAAFRSKGWKLRFITDHYGRIEFRLDL